MGKRGEPEPELIGLHGGGRGAIGEQIELHFLDPVFHAAASAADLFMEGFAADRRRPERGDDG
ncbi:MAG: hypothetical protein R3F54_06465 [Alphaproteobacteria bacterium]